MQVVPLQSASSSKTFRFIIEPKETNACIERASRIVSKTHTIKGFRPGEAPFAILVKILPRHIVYEAILNQALSLVTKKLSQMEKKWFSAPLIEYKGFEEKEHVIHFDMPLEFSVTLASEPIVTLPFYHEIHARQEKTEVTQKEIEEIIGKLAAAKRMDAAGDEFAQSLGNFKDMEQVRHFLKEWLEYEKTTAHLVKARDELLENIRAKSTIDIAPFLIQREAEALVSQQIKEVQARGLHFDEYVKKIAKDKEDFLAQTQRRAEVNVKNWLILKKIAEDEHVDVEEDEVEKRIQTILSTFADPQDFNLDSLKERVRDEMSQEKVFTQILDKQIITK